MFSSAKTLVLPMLALALGACGGEAPEVSESAAEPTATTAQGLTSVTIGRYNIPFYVPPRVAGDADFAGHGPDMDIDFEMELRNGDTELWVGMYVFGQEVGGTTRVEGGVWHKVFTAPSAIVSVAPQPVVASGPEFHHGFRNYGHATKTYQFPQLNPASRLVWQISCVADTDGNEAGSKTGCSSILHEMTLTF
ncbi:hypothetical protein [Archangium primigenium]|uniref:hypothetical protein n=1 Tax=[Archangium] primigenium TaxID=2792470 RepID=UPI00195B5BD8|nr:hypothetical protein [Archangium primigenium]MBM7116466.1 hypothetical protein [Archangium primigenium]